jgi:hypothetical protein
LLADFTSVDFLKMDIEGAEAEVLLDIESELHSVQNLFFEYHSTPGKQQVLGELLSVVTKAGFRYIINGTHGPSLPFPSFPSEISWALRQSNEHLLLSTRRITRVMKRCKHQTMSLLATMCTRIRHFDASKFEDHYEAALLKLLDKNQKGQPRWRPTQATRSQHTPEVRSHTKDQLALRLERHASARRRMR